MYSSARTHDFQETPVINMAAAPFSRSYIHDACLFLTLPAAYAMSRSLIVVGMTLAILGLLFQVWSKAVLRRNRQLTTEGPYALCRNPFYLGNFLFDEGLCLISGHWVLILSCPLIFFWVYRNVIRKEEKHLESLFSEEFRQYCRTTPRFFPLRAPSSRRLRTPFSLDLLRKEKQVVRLLRHLSYPFLIILAGIFWRNHGAPDKLSIPMAFMIALILSLNVSSLMELMRWKRRYKSRANRAQRRSQLRCAASTQIDG